jgi:quinol monooxygenase YgiN
MYLPESGGTIWGMIARITTAPGKRDEMINILESSAAAMPGCLSYVIAKATPAKTFFGSQRYGRASPLTNPRCRCQVRDAIPRAKPLIANFERVAVTIPVWGTQLQP